MKKEGLEVKSCNQSHYGEGHHPHLEKLREGIETAQLRKETAKEEEHSDKTKE